MSNSSKIYDANSENLKLLGRKIANSEIVIFPTETVYGIGGNTFCEKAISNIYRIKNRPNTNPLII